MTPSPLAQRSRALEIRDRAEESAGELNVGELNIRELDIRELKIGRGWRHLSLASPLAAYVSLALMLTLSVGVWGCDDAPKVEMGGTEVPGVMGGGGEGGAGGEGGGGEGGAGEAGVAGATGLAITGCERFEELGTIELSEDLTLQPERCYYLKQNTSLSTQLTIGPGVTLVFAQGVALRVYEGGSIVARGTELSPVVFRGEVALPGFWRGLQIKSLSESELSWVRVEHAGESPWTSAERTNAALYLDGRLKLTDVQLSDNAGYGLIATNDSDLSGMGALRLVRNERALWLDPNVVGSLSEGLNVGAHSEARSIHVGYKSAALTSAQRWLTFEGVPFTFQEDLDVFAPLTLSPGATLIFPEDGALKVEQGGVLVARGEANATIKLRGAEALRGFWRGLKVSNLNDNQLAYVTIEHAGGAPWSLVEGVSAALWLKGKLSVEQVTLKDNSGLALYADDSARLERFEGVRFEGNEGVMWLDPMRVGELSGEVQIQGNDEQRVRVGMSNSATVSAAQRWPSLEAPYLLAYQLNIEAPLSLSEGAELRFVQGSSLRVDGEGSLSVVGSAARPVKLLGEEESLGFWRGLQFKTINEANRLEHVELGYAGQRWTGAAESLAAVHVSRSATLSLASVRFHHLNGAALYVDPNASLTSCAELRLEDSEGPLVQTESAHVDPSCL